MRCKKAAPHYPHYASGSPSPLELLFIFYQIYFLHHPKKIINKMDALPFGTN
jgi:hypothetical protein